MARTLVVGDIHGHMDSVEAALAFDGDVVFIGDYLDSFSQSDESQIQTLLTVLDAAQNTPDRVKALLGNHEMSYLYDEMRCSGWTLKKQNMLIHIQQRMKDVLLPYLWLKGHLISHAGVSQELLEQLDISLEGYLASNSFFQIGYRRGGRDQVGGLYWCDFNYEIVPIPNLIQITGHTNPTITKREQGVRKLEHDNGGVIYNIDNLNRKRESIVVEENGDITIQEF